MAAFYVFWYTWLVFKCLSFYEVDHWNTRLVWYLDPHCMYSAHVCTWLEAPVNFDSQRWRNKMKFKTNKCLLRLLWNTFYKSTVWTLPEDSLQNNFARLFIMWQETWNIQRLNEQQFVRLPTSWRALGPSQSWTCCTQREWPRRSQYPASRVLLAQSTKLLRNNIWK
jgi:hypothetical protein